MVIIRMRVIQRAVFYSALLFLFVCSACSDKSPVGDNSVPLNPTPSDLSLQNRLQGRYTQALFQLNAEGAASGWTAEMHVQAGDLYFSMGNWVDALAQWEATQPSDPARLRQMAELYLSLEQWRNATRTLETLLAQNPQDTWVSYQLGMLLAPFNPQRSLALLQNTDSDDATITEPLMQTLTDYGDDPLVSMYVGITLANLDVWLQAEGAFQQAALVAYPYPEALAYTAIARENQGKDGLAWMTEALNTGDGHAQVHYLNGLFLRGRHEPNASIEAFVRAMSLDPSNPAIAAELATAYQLDFQNERAAFWMQNALIFSNNAPEYVRIAADFYAENGANLSNGGIEVLRQAAELNPQDPEILTNYGWALFSIGEVEQAIQQLNTALDLHPENPRALYYRGSIAYNQSDFVVARDVLQQVIELDADYVTEARALLEFMNTQSSTASTPSSGYDAFDR